MVSDETTVPSSSISKKSICICISGQMRLYEKVFSEIRSQFAEWDVTFIVSVWRQRGGKFLGALNPQQCQRMFPPEVSLMIPPTCLYDNFYLNMPNIRAAIVDRIESRGIISDNMITQYFPHAIIDIEDDSVVQEQIAHLSASEPANSYRMLYKIARANRIKTMLEAERGKKFDIVIRTRPDRPLTTLKISTEILVNQDLIYLDWYQASAPHAGDQVAIGSSTAIDRYASLFNIFDTRLENEKTSKVWTGTHSELAKHLLSQNIEIRAIVPVLPLINEEYLDAHEFLHILQQDERSATYPVKEVLKHFRASIEGSILLTNGDFKNALLKSYEAISANEQLPGAWFLKAQVEMKQGMESEALDSAIRAFSYVGWAKGEYSFISDFIFRICDEIVPEKGLPIAKEYAGKADGTALIHTVIGILYKRLQRYESARRSFSEALDIDPSYYRASQMNELIKNL